LIAGFGLPTEPEPGVLAIADDVVRGVHITRLKHDGSGKAGSDRDKIMIGRPTGSPIVVAPITDSLALVITEGIEEGLSLHAATGLGIWAAGSASHMPALAKAMPSYVDVVTVVRDEDDAGRRGAGGLVRQLLASGFEVEVVTVERRRAAA
jgi:Toprim domain